MLSKLLRILSYLSKNPSAARYRAIRRRLGRLSVQSERTRQTGNQTLVARPVLRAVEQWSPPNGATVQMVVCVHMGTRVLFHAIKPKESETEVVNRLDRIAHCLLVTEEPDLPEEWINQLNTTWNLFEEKIIHDRV